LKRRLRELARIELLPGLRERTADSSIDIAIRARREAYDADFAALRVDVLSVATGVATGVAGPTETRA
jgi:hypothetical protein